jgi:hypothetical protein
VGYETRLENTIIILLYGTNILVVHIDLFFAYLDMIVL